MNTEISQLPDTLGTFKHARINAVDAERFGVVSTDGQRYWLKPAVGCLLYPMVGDRVLVSLDGTDGYIVMVLERKCPESGELRLEGDIRLTLPHGGLTVEARDGIAVNAGPAILLQAQQCAAQLDDAQVDIQTLKMVGTRTDTHWLERHERAIHVHEQVVRHEAEYGDSRRRVEGHEDLQAGSLRQRVDKDWTLRGQTLDMFADSIVAIDGERIKLG